MNTELIIKMTAQLKQLEIDRDALMNQANRDLAFLGGKIDLLREMLNELSEQEHESLAEAVEPPSD